MAGRIAEWERFWVDTLQGESGRVVFEMFFWMFDNDRTSYVDFESVRCPVLVASGSEDRVLAPETARAIAERYGKIATLYRPNNHGHFLLMEPGWEAVAAYCEAWLAQVLPA